MPDGRTIVVVNHPIPGGGWVATHEDITERLQAEAKISHMARHDVLTDLPNRMLFHDCLDDALKHARDEKLAVLCLDIDHFKSVNDTLGHPIGDMLLKAVAGRLRNCVRDSDTVARVGGDEFAVVQAGASQPTDATTLATRLIETISAPYKLDGHHVVVGLSIGIAIPPIDGNDPNQLLKAADMALYRAKSDGRGVFRFFEAGDGCADAGAPCARARSPHRRSPKGNSSCSTSRSSTRRPARIRAFEALLRWHHPERGIVSPADFIPLAEETGLIVPIGEWVLRQACKEAATWPDDISLATNLSPIQFKSNNLLPTVISALGNPGCRRRGWSWRSPSPPCCRRARIPSPCSINCAASASEFRMDDFGTGYSSLAYLQKFPFDKIKIDKSFVHDMMNRDDSLAIVRAIAAMGASLGIMTTAEGVETAEQFERLKAEGCTEVQGYLFSPPRPAADIRGLLHKFNPRLKAIA